jgi:protein-disulfide isomerase
MDCPMLRPLTALALLAAGLLSLPPARAEEAGALPRDEIEKIVREYLLREPEVIYDAIQVLQERREAAERERQRSMIVARAPALFDNPTDPVAGNPDGDVTVVEFFDYRCGYCRSMVPGLRDLIATDGNLRFVFKELPVLGPESEVAARAALAAALQGSEKYLKLHFALMGSKDLSLDAVKALAGQVGLDVPRLLDDMGGDAVKRTLAANHALAQELGISGTPSFVIGDRLIPGAVDVAQLAALIDEQRRAASGG